MKTAQRRIVGPRSIFVEPERGRVLAPGEQETVLVDGSPWAQVPRTIVNRHRTERVVFVFLDHGACRISEVRDIVIAVLLIIKRRTAVHSGVGAHQNLVNPFTIHILRYRVVWAIFQDRVPHRKCNTWSRR